MDKVILVWLLGLISTVVGTVIGWILNQYSKKGKVKIWNKDVKFFEHPKSDKMGGSNEKEIIVNKDVELYSNQSEIKYIRTSFDVFNSSQGERRIIRELIITYDEVQFFPFKDGLKDNIVLNIAPGEIKTVNLTFYISPNEKVSFDRNKRLKYQYRDHKNKIRSKHIQYLEA